MPLPNRSLPDLIIIGGQKCGTSTLFASLGSHTDVHPALDPSTGKPVKEVNFFGNLWDRGLDWYESHFTSTSGSSMEATPNYLCDVEAHARMADIVPDAKLIVSLRDPVARAYSQFNHYSQSIDVTRGWDWRRPGESFSANIQAELDQPKRRWYGLLARGFYHTQLEHLLQFFSRDQIHIMIMEQWVAEPDAHFQHMLDFAGLPAQTLDKNVIHMRAYTVDPLDRETHTQLREIYRPHNERLFEFLGQSIDQWDVDPVATTEDSGSGIDRSESGPDS